MSIKLYGNTHKKKNTKEPGKNSGKQPEGFAAAKPAKKVRAKKIMIIAALALVVLTATGFALHKILVKPPEVINNGNEITVGSGAREKDFLTFVVCGTDEGGSRTDTIMVVAYDIANKKINVASVPRDTMLNVSWSVKKINSAYAFDGIGGLKDELKNLLGFGVDYYATVDLKAFRDIVDAIGGVKFYVPEDMYYEDPTQDLYINLKEGEQVLNGEKAMELIRFRGYAQADIKRISVQQDFMKAVFAQLLKFGNVAKVNEIAGILTKYMDTDLTTGNIVWIGEKMLSLKAEDVHTLTLPGKSGPYNGLSYWYLDAKGVLDCVNKYLSPYSQDIKLGDMDIVTVENGYIVSSTGKKVKDTKQSSDVSEDEPEPEVTVTPEATPTPTPTPTSTPTPTETPKTTVPPSTSSPVQTKPPVTTPPIQTPSSTPITTPPPSTAEPTPTPKAGVPSSSQQ